jgi:hypothetical protein
LQKHQLASKSATINLLWGEPVRIAPTTPRLCRRLHVGEQGRLPVRREAVRLDVPPDWQLTLILAGMVVGLLAVLLFEVAKWYL